MTRVLVMGPSEWDPARGRVPLAMSPMAIRRRAADLLRTQGITADLMEDLPDQPGEDILDKFRRLATRSAYDTLLVVWPARAKMQTTYDELLLLREWRDVVPTVWLLHQAGTIGHDDGRFRLPEPGGRSRYLEALAGLPVQGRAWGTLAEMQRQVAELAGEWTL